jgi:bifunctional DNA-binding transcriptional regulator/antitoxin component of YhaV-PrlF toxin-antitoxin module
MAGGSFSLVWSGNLTLTEVAPFVNQFCDVLKFVLPIRNPSNMLSFGKFRISEFLEQDTPTLQIRDKGTITLPASLRKKYTLQQEEVLTVVDPVEGTILLRPMVSQVDKLSRQTAKRLKKRTFLWRISWKL